jgi:hypothetical protein
MHAGFCETLHLAQTAAELCSRPHFKHTCTSSLVGVVVYLSCAAYSSNPLVLHVICLPISPSALHISVSVLNRGWPGTRISLHGYPVNFEAACGKC